MTKAILAIIFSILVVEGLLLIFDIPRKYQSHSEPLQFLNSLNRSIGYTNVISTSIDFQYDGNPRGYFRENNVVQHVTNSAGFRGPEIRKTKDPGAYRILFLGDSFTFGEGVYFEDIYPERFKKLAQDKEAFQKNVESINLAVGGYNTEQEYRMLEYASELLPDRVVVGFTMNDADDPIFTFDADGNPTRVPTGLESRLRIPADNSWLYGSSRTYRIFSDWQQARRKNALAEEYYRFLYSDGSARWEDTKRAIARFGAYQKEHGVPVTFLIFPLLVHLDQYPFLKEHDKVRQELERNGIGYVEILPALSGYRDTDLWVHPTDQHPNEIVHRIAAEALLDYIGQRK